MTDQITVPRATWDALREAFDTIIQYNRNHARDQYGDAEKAERWACVVKARQALTAANAVSEPVGINGLTEAETSASMSVMGLTPESARAMVAEMADLSLTNEGDMLAKQPEILAEYTGINGVRQWASVGAWLYEGDAIAVISDHFRDATKMVQPLGWYCVSRDGLVTQCADQRDTEMTAKSGDRDWPGSAPYRAVQLCEFEAPPQATEPAWRPIETAPKDGSEILLAHPDGSMVVGWWRENGLHGRASGWSDGDDFAMEWPSHWMPLPAAPEEKQ